MSDDSYRDGRNRGVLGPTGDWNEFQRGRADADRWDAEMSRRDGQSASGIPKGAPGAGSGGGGGGIALLVVLVVLIMVIVPAAVIALPAGLLLMALTPVLSGAARVKPSYAVAYKAAFFGVLVAEIIFFASQFGLMWFTQNYLTQAPGFLRQVMMAAIAMLSQGTNFMGDLLSIPTLTSPQHAGGLAQRDTLLRIGLTDNSGAALLVAFLAIALPPLLAMAFVLSLRLRPAFNGWLGKLRALAAAVVMLAISVPLTAWLIGFGMTHAEPFQMRRASDFSCILVSSGVGVMLWSVFAAFALWPLLRVPAWVTRRPATAGYGTAFLALFAYGALLMLILFLVRDGDAALSSWLLWPQRSALPGWDALAPWLPWQLGLVAVVGLVVSWRAGGVYKGALGWVLATIWTGGWITALSLAALRLGHGILPLACNL